MSEFPVLVPHYQRPAWFWRVIFIGAPIALGLGTVGFLLHDHETASLGSWLDALYHSVQLFIFHMPHTEGPVNWYLELGRWLAAGLFGFAAMIALYDILMTELQHARLRFASEHTDYLRPGAKGDGTSPLLQRGRQDTPSGNLCSSGREPNAIPCRGRDRSCREPRQSRNPGEGQGADGQASGSPLRR